MVTNADPDGRANAWAGTGGGSMSGGNTVSAKPAFQPPGSDAEQIPDGIVNPLTSTLPAAQDARIPGLGQRGGEDRGDGTDPGAGHSWAAAGSADLPGGDAWSTARQPVRSEGND